MNISRQFLKSLEKNNNNILGFKNRNGIWQHVNKTDLSYKINTCMEILKDNNIQKCIVKGLTVIEGDAEKDLKHFPSSSYDFVILSQTLQAFLDPEKVIKKGKCSVD